MQTINENFRGAAATIEQLDSVETPEKTKTWTPIAHTRIVDIAKNSIRDMHPDWNIRKETHKLSKNKQNVFSSYELDTPFSRPDNTLMFSTRSSINKTYSVMGAAGIKVLVCSNGAYVMSNATRLKRKHTGDVLEEDIYQKFCFVLESSAKTYKIINGDFDLMRSIEIDNDAAYEMTGFLQGHNVLNNKRRRVTLGDWFSPRHEEFEPRTMYSYYNCVTESLKSVPVGEEIKLHDALHTLVMDRYVNCYTLNVQEDINNIDDIIAAN